MAGLRLGMLLMLALMALATQAGAEDSVTGVWQGEYSCAQGRTGLTLTVTPAGADRVRALFRFYAIKGNPLVPDGCFEMTDAHPAPWDVALTAGRWLLRPPGYVTVDLTGTLSTDHQAMSGIVTGPFCTSFMLHRVTAPQTPVPGACRGETLVSSLDH